MLRYRGLRIPPEHYSTLAKLIQMEEGPLAELRSAIETTKPTLLPADFNARVAAKTTTFDGDEVDEILDVLMSLYLTRANFEASASEFVDLLCKAIEETGAEELKAASDNPEVCKQHFEMLLNMDQTLGVVSKGFTLEIDHERTLHDMRIFTDLRPIFASDANMPPIAGVIVHKLRITYHQDNSLKDFYVALDSDDLERLLSLAQRSLKKAKSLKSFVESAKAYILEGDDDA